jgi:hypothetical protein
MRHSIDNPNPQLLIGDCAVCGPNTPLKFLKGKPLADGSGYGSYYQCRIRENETKRESAKRNRTVESARENHLRRYGLTTEKFNALLASQGNACAICKTTEPRGQYNAWHVDHNHACCPRREKGSVRSCGKCIRGLLCHACNTALGGFKDSPALLQAAIEYLRAHKPI